MTSASELFCKRRSRLGLGRPTLDLGLDSSSSSPFSDVNSHHNHRRHYRNSSGINSDHHHHHHHRRHDLDGCDSIRRPSHVRHLHHRALHSEHESVRLDQGTRQHSSGNNINIEIISSLANRPIVTSNDRLPGTVLLARERLLQRLRGVSISGNRQTGRALSGVYLNISSDDSGLVDSGEWETEIFTGLSAGGTTSTDLTSQRDQLTFLGKSCQKPPGLTEETLACLHLEVFSSMEKGIEGLVSRASCECSICLESFMEGDELVRLPCGHRFHSGCLGPWVRTCGDCPYCRRGIVVSSHTAIETT